MRAVACLLMAATLSSAAACAPSKYHAPAQLSNSEELFGDGSFAGFCNLVRLELPEWPAGFSSFDRAALSLALSVSGSFEGSLGWSNLARDFDGQGLSLGLLNQNLGTGSLQPLLIEMRDNYDYDLKGTLTAQERNSLLEMLGTWQSATFRVDRKTVFSFEDDLALVHVFAGPETPAQIDQWAVLSRADSGSVVWAEKNLYRNGSFDNGWKSGFQRLASTKTYVALQIRAAFDIHRKTLSEMKVLGLSSLRDYLFLFDTNVQNGGLFKSDVVGFSRSGNDVQDLRELLSLRLRHVKPRFFDDVFARKMAIISGSGRVHGRERSLENDFCYSGSDSYQF